MNSAPGTSHGFRGKGVSGPGSSQILLEHMDDTAGAAPISRRPPAVGDVAKPCRGYAPTPLVDNGVGCSQFYGVIGGLRGGAAAALAAAAVAAAAVAAVLAAAAAAAALAAASAAAALAVALAAAAASAASSLFSSAVSTAEAFLQGCLGLASW